MPWLDECVVVCLKNEKSKHMIDVRQTRAISGVSNQQVDTTSLISLSFSVQSDAVCLQLFMHALSVLLIIF